MFLFLVIAGIVVFLVVKALRNNSDDTFNPSGGAVPKYTPYNQPNGSSQGFSAGSAGAGTQITGPTSEVIQVVEEYKELKDPSVSIDKYERNRRCDALLIEFDWQTDPTHSSFHTSWGQANFKLLWNAVVYYDVVYQGDRYPMGMMSDICLDIQERNSRRTL